MALPCVDANLRSGSRATPTTTNTTEDNQDLDPAAFLKSVRELSEKREREDAERFRKLEEEVERSRAQRAARRAERERSLSPEKSSTPLSTSTSTRHRSTPSRASRTASPTPSALSIAHSPPAAPMDTARALPPPPDSPTKDVPEFAGFGSLKKKAAPSASPPIRSVELFDPPRASPSATTLARSGTLSWQQRPEFKTGGRPVSIVAPSVPSHSQQPSIDQPEPSRDQIAASLGSRDPSWFKQTADRGIGSPAYKKSNDEAAATPGEIIRRGLPGMSRGTETRRERERTRSPAARPVSQSPKVDTARDSPFMSSRFSPTKTQTPSPNKPDLKALLAEDEAQKQASPMEASEQHRISRAYTMSPSQSNLTNDRPSSPTKGYGGFVQSAVMKRSESVTKRWSAQPPMSSFGRPGSALSHVSSIGGLQGSQSMPRLEPSGSDQLESAERIGRSSSRNHAGLTVSTGETDEAGFVKPSIPHHSRSRSVASPYAINTEAGPGSPSVAKRFSPTKSSWIESALGRPESPTKPMAPAKNTQPAWMANIAKAKAEKAGGDYTPRLGTPKAEGDDEARSRSASPSKTPFGQGLLRRSESRDLAAVPPSSTPPPRTTSTSSFSKPADSFEGSPRPFRQRSERDLRAESRTESRVDEVQRPAELVESTAAPSESIKSTPQPTVSKPKPATPPKPSMDFRSNLRPRAPTEGKQEEQPEFLSRFGNLKRTKTEKYVAPDLLKKEINRGKSELTKTDGPVKTARRDELKDSLLAKKEEIRKAKEEGRDLPGQAHERKNSNAPITPSKPEALMRRELLGRSNSNGTADNLDKHSNSEAPQPAVRQMSMRPKPDMEPWKQTSLPVETQPKFEPLSKQTSLPNPAQNAPTEKSKLAARFNPSLAGMLARGPPSASPSNAPSRSESPAQMSSFSEPPTEGAPLQDMRKGRAKGPKKRGSGTRPEISTSRPEPAQESLRAEEPPAPMPAPKPRALPGSAASLMMASMTSRVPPTSDDREPASIPTHSSQANSPETVDIPEFGGFGSARKKPMTTSGSTDDDKENSSGNGVVSDKAAEASASFWNRHRGPAASQTPTGDMGSTLTRSVAQPSSSSTPTRPARSSRVVSGQLREGSPNK